MGWSSTCRAVAGTWTFERTANDCASTCTPRKSCALDWIAQVQGVHGLCSRWTEETQSSSGHLKTGVSHFVGKVSKEGGFCTKILITAGIGTPRLCTLGVGVWRSSDDDEAIGTSMTSCHPIVEELAASAKNHEVSLTAFVTSVLRGLRRTQEEVTGSVDVQSTFNTLLQGAHHGVRISLKLHQLPGLGWWWDPTSRSSDSPPFPPSRHIF